MNRPSVRGAAGAVSPARRVSSTFSVTRATSSSLSSMASPSLLNRRAVKGLRDVFDPFPFRPVQAVAGAGALVGVRVVDAAVHVEILVQDGRRVQVIAGRPAA